MDSSFILSLIVGIFTGTAAGYLGSFMVLKRMALVGDALTHVALPGIGIALLLNLDPFLGAFVFLFLASFIIWHIEEKTKLSVETVVGILFTASLALGVLITPKLELLEALFGDITKVGLLDAVFTVPLSIAAVLVMSRIKRGFILGTISSDFAKSSGFNISKLNLVFLLLVSTVVALGIKVVGTLLMGALVIIPAATSKNFTKNFSSYTFWSIIIGGLSVILGFWLAWKLQLPPGPIIVLTSIVFFILSMLRPTAS